MWPRLLAQTYAISANYTYDSFSRMTGLTAKNGVPLTTKMPHI